MKSQRENIFFTSCYLLLIVCLNSCASSNIMDDLSLDKKTEIITPVIVETRRTFTDRTLYTRGERVELQPFDIINKSAKPITIDTILIKIGTAATNSSKVILEKTMATSYHIDPHQQFSIPEIEIVEVNDRLDDNSYLVHATLILSVQDSTSTFKQAETVYLTFFRIAESNDNLTYSINSRIYDSLAVFTLHGGLSAEYTVQKSAAALAGGISHSWNIPSAGMGPAPIKSTPDFLERSLQQTVDFYDSTFGTNEIFETVIISTGIPSGAYLARAMNAPVLPIHFLVGAHTTTEILPVQYQQFLTKHQVQNVIFHGALGLGGESAAKKLKEDKEHYGSGSIYVMHFAGDKSETYLNQTIHDFDQQKLGSLIHIADWEAGIIDRQIDNIGKAIRQTTLVDDIELVTTHDAIHLWNMGTYMMLHLLRKNNLDLKGISFNPYLIGHPVFETYQAYIPFLYWQGFEPQHHINTRLNTIIRDAVYQYYPNTNLEELICWVNSTNNFGGSAQGVNMSNTLSQNGFRSIINNDFTIGEVWNLSDSVNAAVEVRADNLVQSGIHQLKQWNQNLQFLTIADLKEIANQWSDILVLSK